MSAAGFGHPRVVRILLKKGANVEIADDEGATSLHLSAQEGHLAVTKLLLKFGAALEARTVEAKKTLQYRCTPIHLAARHGYSEIVSVLIEAGADSNSRTMNGSTALYNAAQLGHVGVVKVLLRAKTNPLLTCSEPGSSMNVPLDAAAAGGHLKIVYELIQEHGIEGCGGASGGVNALQLAATNQHVDIMEMLTSAGVVDTRGALRGAIHVGRQSSVTFLVGQWKRNASLAGSGYLDTCDPSSGSTPLVVGIRVCHPCSPRIARMLVDAGADTCKGGSTVKRIRRRGCCCYPPGSRGKFPQPQDARRQGRHSQPATPLRGYPAVADEGGGSSCDVLAVGKHHALRDPRCSSYYCRG